MNLLFILTLFPYALAQLNHTLSPLSLNRIKMEVKSDEISYSQSVNLLFGIDNEIHGEVYESDQALLSEEIHNSSFYNKSTSCRVYPTEVKFKSFGIYDLKSTIWDSALIGTNLYILESLPLSQMASNTHLKKSQISLYVINESQIKFQQVVMRISDLNLRDQIDDQIVLTDIKGNLYFTDGMQIYVYNQKTRTSSSISEARNTILNTEAQLASGDIIKFQQIKSKKESGLFHLVMSTKIIIMQLISFDSYKEILRLSPSQNRVIFDAETNSQDYFTLEDSTLNVFSLNNLSGGKSVFQLESKVCRKMEIRQYVVYVVCEENGLNYVAQLYYIENRFYLNKYWNHMQDVKNVFAVGDAQIFVAGDEDINLMQVGTHRQVLADLDRIETKYTYRSFGLQKIQTFLQTSSESQLVGIGVNFLAFFSLQLTSPSLTCTFSNSVSRHSILVAFNQTNLNSTPVTVNQILLPFIYYQSSLDVTQQSSHLFVLLGLLFALSILFIMLGCYCKNRAFAAKAMLHISKKIQDFKNKRKQMKPL